MKGVVEEPIRLVPQSTVTHGVYRVGYIEEMLKKFAGDIFIQWIDSGRQFDGDFHHVEAVHRHPTGAVRLFDMAAGGQRRRTVEHANIIEPEKSSFKNIA